MKIDDLIFASGNQQKADEYKSVLGLPNLKQSIVETDDVVNVNLEQLVRRKVDQVKLILQDQPFFVDHTGLLVDALNELPGGQTSHFLRHLGCEKFCGLIASGASRTARAKTVIGFHHKGESQYFEGSVFGEVTSQPRGDGLGFDPIFVQEGFTRTYAELGDRVVYRHSMRREACKKFAKFLSKKDSGYAPPPLFPTTSQTSGTVDQELEKRWDFFLSHTSDDKIEVARPLYEALTDMGYAVWYDEATLRVGDSLRERIDEGLSNSRFGILILSPAFFEKPWPKNELAGLFAIETNSGTNAILPIWHSIDGDELVKFSPMLSDRVSTRTNIGIRAVADVVAEVAGIPLQQYSTQQNS